MNGLPVLRKQDTRARARVASLVTTRLPSLFVWLSSLDVLTNSQSMATTSLGRSMVESVIGWKLGFRRRRMVETLGRAKTLVGGVGGVGVVSNDE